MASIDDDLGGVAADPRTDWDTLHWLAENHPSLRPAIAENPATYPELLEALASLGDPEIDAALARREAAPAAVEPEAAEPEASPAADPAQPAAAGAAESPWFANGSFDGAPAGYSTMASPAHSPAARPAPYQRRTSRAPRFVLAVLLPVLVLVALTALALSMLDGRSAEDFTAAEAPAQAQPSEGAEDDSEDESGEEPEPSPTPEPPTPDELRAEVAALPEESSCDSPAEDGEVLAALASATSQDGSWVESEDGTLVQDALTGLQESCDSSHAAALFLDLRGSEETATALRGTAQDMGSDWIQAAAPAQGLALASFVSPDGNVLCELADTMRCRVLQHSFAAPDGCTEGVTYAIEVDRPAEPDCENPVLQQGQQVLGYGQTASNEFFACTSFQSQMSCWNQLTGEGINLSASRNWTY
ncbi:hypothetical protein [Nesterenkonia sp. CF4.4]|uniref:variant leucine-rich repeat-containing protein n=1 Tax=Nesterenkonia sp. CF4.4 TaxID=3373079 RepID=UPI003EE66063